MLDLHSHSTASDGELSPSSLVFLAKERGLCLLALTDHDTLDGIEEGKVLGEAVLRYDGKPVARVPLVARENVDKGFSLSSFIVSIIAPLITK